MSQYAPISSVEFPELDEVVLLELLGDEEKSFVFEIRYRSFASFSVEGDHAYLDDINTVKRELELTYGIQPDNWRELTSEEIVVINSSIR